MSPQNKVCDPVCEMEVDPDAYVYEYIECQYAFCSQQCHDRFVANPHLYIGHPGKPSPKQHGARIIKCRVLKLDTIIPDDIALKIDIALKKMMGIKEVTIDKCIVRITYDLLEATTKQIEKTIEHADKTLTVNWAEKLKRAFIHYFVETELDSLEAQNKKHKSCH
jgi:YHS domain-containing protein